MATQQRVIVVTALVILCSAAAGLACTVFAIHDGEAVLFGNNEDYALAEHRLKTQPTTERYYGCVFFGFDYYAQGGINTAGLCFDATGVPGPPANALAGECSASNPVDFCQAALRECATIGELEIFLSTRHLGRINGGQFLFADSSGASLVLCVDAHGEIVIDRTEGSHRVITNFNVVSPHLGGYPCPRYRRASSDLATALANEGEVSVDSLASTLEAVHFSGGPSETMYSSVFDLSAGVIHLFYRHDFDSPLVLQVEELVANAQDLLISALFAD